MEQNHNQSRYIPLAGAANVRDLGGCPLPGGGTTAWGRFLRADSTASLTPQDIDLLKERGMPLFLTCAPLGKQPTFPPV